jgi:hypothetical protein
MATLSRASSRIPLWTVSRSAARLSLQNNAIAYAESAVSIKKKNHLLTKALALVLPLRRWHDTMPQNVCLCRCRISITELICPSLSSAYRHHHACALTNHVCTSLKPKKDVNANIVPRTSGNIGTWQKKAGDNLAPGDVLVEIETDKAQMDFEFQEEGTLAKILKGSGEKDIAVGSVSLAYIHQ